MNDKGARQILAAEIAETKSVAKRVWSLEKVEGGVNKKTTIA